MKEIVCKILIAGPVGVGKSKFLLRYTEDVFYPNYEPTIGADLGIKRFTLPPDNKVKLEIWDISGNESFRNINRTYYRNSNVILVAVDLTVDATKNKNDLTNLFNQYDEYSDPRIVKFLVGTKADHKDAKIDANLMMMQEFTEDRQITNCHAYKDVTSSRENENITGAFEIPTKIYIEQQNAPKKEMPKAETELRFTVIGSQESGKTKLSEGLQGKKFTEQYNPTTGAAFGTRKIATNQNLVLCNFYDTSGNARYGSVNHTYLRRSHIIFITVDLTETAEKNRQILNGLYTLHKSVDEMTNTTTRKVLVGTKGEEIRDWENNPNYIMMQEFAETHANENFIAYHKPTSAKENLNIEELLLDNVKSCLDDSNKENSINYKNFYPTLSALTSINNAIKNTTIKISSLEPKTQQISIERLTAFRTSLETLRNKLVDIYLQRLPNDIIEKINKNGDLTSDQKERLSFITELHCKDITKIAINANKIALYVNDNVGTFEEIKDIPEPIKKAASEIRDVFEFKPKTCLKIVAVVLFTGLCALIGAAIGFGIGSVPAATIGTLLGIKISTTMLGLGTVTGGIGALTLGLGMFRHAINNRNAIKESSDEIEKTAQEAILIPPMQP